MFSAAFAVFNCLGVAFVLLPIPWHWRARNTPTLLLIFWCIVTVLPMAINSLVWYDGVHIKAPIYCDIVTKLRIGATVGTPASVLCITRQLESIAAARTASFTVADRRRRQLVDLAIGLGIPCLVMILHTVVQGHRYDIIERVGCVPAVYWSLPSIFLVTIWGLILDIVAAVYAVLAMRLFVIRRYQFNHLLEASKSAISTGRFIRLMALSALQIVYTFPVTLALQICQLIDLPLNPYVSWDNVHFGFNYVGVITLDDLALLPTAYRQLQELSQWSYAVSSALFFLFFGLGEEALVTYRSWWRRLRSICGVAQSSDQASSIRPDATQISLPPYPRSQPSYTEEDGKDVPPVQGIRVTVEEENYTSV